MNSQKQLEDLATAAQPMVAQYLDHCRAYAALTHTAALEAAKEVWGDNAADDVLHAKVDLTRTAPKDLVQKLDAVRKKVRGSYVVVCPATMAIYVFGPNV